ncbi:MAG: nucleotidyltransferase family protein [Proteobacteria bacterium]|nr:nucleotidyltransferase family protein [Pseudomonadota bacterium]
MMQALILAGGLGTRLGAITKQIPKPMVPINGRPFLEIQMEYLRENGITDIVLSVGYLGDQIEEYFGDGSGMGLKIEYSFEDVPVGTGGGVKLAADKLHEEFFLLYGDSYLPIDYREVEEAFKASGKTGLLVAYDNRLGDTTVPCNLSVDSDMLVTEYRKDAKSEELHLVEAGVLAFKKSVLDLIPNTGPTSLEEEVFARLIADKEMACFTTRQRFYDIGLPERLEKLEELFR